MIRTLLHALTILALVLAPLPANSAAASGSASIAGRVTDAGGRGVSGVVINAIPAGCPGMGQLKPVLLVNGWGGSVGKTFSSEDENMRYLSAALEAHGYVEGCNLFLASGTSPAENLAKNAEIIYQDLCRAEGRYEKNAGRAAPAWNIIGFSYGGLRARAFLESGFYGRACPAETSTTNIPRVENLITAGTMHAGEWGELPLATILGLNGLAHWQENRPAILELAPPVRLWQNLHSQQPAGVRYTSIGGDARPQIPTAGPGMWALLYNAHHNTRDFPNDLAVSQASAFALSLMPNNYPDVHPIGTYDVHGGCNDDDQTNLEGKGCSLLGLNAMASYFNHSDTVEQKIWPILAASNAGQPYPFAAPAPAAVQHADSLAARMAQPVTVGGVPLTEIAAGQMDAWNDFSTGTFTVPAAGESQVRLNWTGGDLTLTLVDPNGQIVSPGSAGVTMMTTALGDGWATLVQFDSILAGEWTFQVQGQSLAGPAAFRLFMIPARPAFIEGTLPEWLPSGSPAPLAVTAWKDGSTRMPGASVIATVTRPDGGIHLVSLLDDGAHADGAAGDGEYGGEYPYTDTGGVYSVLFSAAGDDEGVETTLHASGLFTVAPPGAALGSTYSDHGYDPDHDGYFNALEIDVPITVAAAGSYRVSAEIYAGAAFLGVAQDLQVWEPGSQTARLRLGAGAITQAQAGGPYTVRNVMLLDETSITLLVASADPFYQTQAYPLEAFFSPFKLFLPGLTTPAKAAAPQAAAPQAAAAAASYSALTGPNGEYSFSGLPDGSYTLVPSLAGRQFLPAARVISLPASGSQDFQLTTVLNNPPSAPSAPLPAFGAALVPQSVTLGWAGGDPDWDNTVTYTVYIDTVSPPALVQAGGLASPSLAVSLPYDNTTYYWKVAAKDNYGAVTQGPVWSFRTKPGASTAARIDAGEYHSCAVTAAGGVKCWGLNAYGQLGNNSTTDSPVPVDVVGLNTGVQSISTSGNFTCHLTSEAGVVGCWGLNDHGQLGNNTTTNSAVPVAVVGLPGGVKAISAGNMHACAITAAGGVVCWGWNAYGQLGNNSTADSAVPVAVVGLSSGVKAIASGSSHTCALLETGALQCWGNNAFGQLGNNSTTNSAVPVAVTGLTSGVLGVSAGSSFTCAIAAGGAAKCWGMNSFGQLGNNSTTASSVPVSVVGLSAGVTDLSAGQFHACVVVAGGAKCWGANGFGQLGSSTTVTSLVPVSVVGLSVGVKQVSAGSEPHACAVTNGGAAMCWGFNGFGQLGDSSTSDSHVPVGVEGLTGGWRP